MLNQNIVVWFFVLFVAIFSLLQSCKEEVKIPDTSEINVNLNITRFEDELFSLDTTDIVKSFATLENKYPTFYKLYFNNILPLTKDSSQLAASVLKFISDPAMRKLKDTTATVINNFDEIESELTKAIKLIKFYEPNYREPNFYTFISEYSYQNFIFEDNGKDGIGIGLDMFLGASFDYKKIDPQSPNFSDYITRTFNRDHIVPKTIEIIIDDLVGEASGNNLLDLMLHNGKKIYLKKKFLPTTNDTLIYEYDANQMKWVEENELEIWSFFIDQNLMYESTFSKINKYVNPSPNSPGMPKEAPGKTANYIGYKIIESYMDKFPKTELKDLMQMNDSKLILEMSKYKPKRK